MLSEPLVIELHFEVYLPWLSVHAFFQRFAAGHGSTFRNICHNVISTVQLSRGDVLFSPGQSAKYMFFVKSGFVYYKPPHREVGIISSNRGTWTDQHTSNV